jgi:N-acetylneuraminic acid mutarotase
MKSALRLAILIFSFLALLSACGGGNGTPPVSFGRWTWVSGSNIKGQAGIYGIKGVAVPSNVPGARQTAVSWLDSRGRLWLFGGNGHDSAGSSGDLNDLWYYDPTTHKWTWVSGSNIEGQAGMYGTKGVADPSNVPGARQMAVSWLDSRGKIWLFGGSGVGGYLNDLWQFDPTILEWTWVSGSKAEPPNSINPDGVYGTRGVADPSNIPGGRYGAVSWIDSRGKLWLFGGYGRDSASWGWLNDLWTYDPTSLEWTWMSGGNTGNQAGAYGIQGTADPSNVPGGRYWAVSWIDSQDKLWLFGGYGYDSGGYLGQLNDLWEYDLTTHEWTWVSGSNTGNQAGIYGTKDIAAPANVPGGRHGAMSWIDSQGKLWLFGGSGYNSVRNYVWLNDLWKYDPTTTEWTWVSGSNTGNQAGIYGTKDTAASSNVPGGRNWAISWIDSQGRLWLFGGEGYYSAGDSGDINDLWRYGFGWH